MLRAVLVLALCCGGFSGDDYHLTATPWCDNSMRIRISPTAMPPAALAAKAALAKSLAAKNMSDLASAMLETCGPGSPSSLRPGATLKHQNLAVRAGIGGLSFSRVDTGEPLFSVTASFEYNQGFETSSSQWRTLPDKVAGGCSGSEYDGSLGSASTAAECLSKVVDARSTGSRINYGVWRGDSNKGCFVCDLTDRGEASTWKLQGKYNLKKNIRIRHFYVFASLPFFCFLTPLQRGFS